MEFYIWRGEILQMTKATLEEARTMLNSYLIDKNDIKNIELEIEALKKDYDIRGMAFSEKTGETFNINKELENRVVNKSDRIKKLERIKRIQEINCAKIQNAHNSLKQQFEKDVIRLRYMESPTLQWREISKEIGFTSVACQKAEERAVKKMIPLLFKEGI